MKNVFTSLFTSKSGFLDGMASTLDIGATLNDYDLMLTPEEADRVAIANDWRIVGSDLKAAIETYE